MSSDAAANFQASLASLDRGNNIEESSHAALAGQSSIREGEWTPILPAEKALPENIYHPKYGEPDAVYRYLDEQGRILNVVLRFDKAENRKHIVPYTYGKINNQAPRWHWRGPKDPYHIFGLAELATRLDAPVLVVEGEKTALAATEQFASHVVITSRNGARAAAKTDWSQLGNRDVTIWPDNDNEGDRYATDVARFAYAAGAQRVRTVKLPPTQFPQKWDLADACPEGVSLSILTAMMAEAADAVCEAELPFGFELRDDGLWSANDGNGEGKEPPERWICGPFEFVAEARTPGGRGWGLVLRWRDPDQRQHQWIMPREFLHSEGADLERKFEDQGLRVSSDRKGRHLLRECLAGARTARRVEIADRNGWHRLMDEKSFTYMHPGIALSGSGAGRVLLQEPFSVSAAGAFAQSGNFAAWREQVAMLASGNDLLILAICMAFAGPLLDIVGMRSFGVHIAGHSRTGKTTALRVAGSVWGRPETGAELRTWRATANGVEGAAAFRNDNLLLLDEMAEADPRDVDAVIYSLGNGSGKTRADRTGAARRANTWRLTFLSTGEMDLATKLGEAGKRVMAGQEVRMPSLSADAGAGLGIFQFLHGEESGAAFAESLDAETRRKHGTAGIFFIQQLLAVRSTDSAGLAQRLSDAVNAYADLLAPSGSDGQVRTLARNFAQIGRAHV